jgi:dTMP kinase
MAQKGDIFFKSKKVSMKGGRGKLIVLEGIDGSGKTTQLERAFVWLRRKGRQVVKLREPTDGHYGRILRASARHGRLSPENERDHFVLDRQWNVEHNIRPALEGGKVVLLDRYYYSSIAYQGSRGLDLDDIRRRNEAIALKPDLVLLLDLEPEMALERIQRERGDAPNLYEDLDYLRKVRDVFLTLPDACIVRIEASQPEDAVWKEIEENLERLLKEN